MGDSPAEQERPHGAGDLRERLGRMRAIVSEDPEDSKFRLGVGELIALIVPIAVAFGLARQLKTAEPPECLATFLIGAAACFLTAIVMVRRDRAKLRVALLVALEFAIVAGTYLTLGVIAAKFR